MTYGIDVSKDTLVVCTPAGTPVDVPNTPAAVAAWLATVPPTVPLAMEATGRYHRLVADLAVSQGRTVYVFNPRDVHRYGQSVRPRASTDPVAARVIAWFAEAAPHPAYQVPEADAETLRTLGRQRAALVRQQVQLQHQVREAPALSPVLQEVQTALRTTIARLTQTLAPHVQADAAVRPLLAIPGFGPVVTAYLGAILTPHTFPTSDALVAFLGWDLRVKDSGKTRGVRRLSKRGDPEARRLLYLAASAAWRCSAEFRAVRERALAAGYSTIEATVIVARKLVRVAWSLYTHQTPYRPERVLANR